jgi:hypothetical protein
LSLYASLFSEVFKRGVSPSLQNVSPFPCEGKGGRGIGSMLKRDEVIISVSNLSEIAHFFLSLKPVPSSAIIRGKASGIHGWGGNIAQKS